MTIVNISVGKGPKGSCVPFVSEYTDCTEVNRCTGCTRCTCSAHGSWTCSGVRECPGERDSVEQQDVHQAFNSLLYDFKTKPSEKYEGLAKQKKDEESLLDDNAAVDKQILSMLTRKKRSSKKSKKESRKKLEKDDKRVANDSMLEEPDTVKFYHTVDELNEDTLKHSNISGTIEAQKVEMSKLMSRRFNKSSKDNGTFDYPLQIEYNKPNSYNIDNKIDGNSSAIIPNSDNLGIITNITQKERDSDVSKLVVGELKSGTEFIGDKNAPIMSNITFTPENDTLTAMAFIAGNLLNRLWSIEKESGEESMEIEAMKTEKLQDLLDLFKEPLTMRQEAFLKNALESLHRAIEQHKDEKNITICESLGDAKKFLEDSENMEWEKSEVDIPSTNILRKSSPKPDKEINKDDATSKAASKIGRVLNLMKKYESLNHRINNIKKSKDRKKPTARMLDYEFDNFNDTDSGSLNLFGRILEKITRLLLPYKGAKKITNKIKSLSVLSNKDDKIKQKVKDTFDIDMGNLSLSIKDKIILDYLTRIKNSPRTLFDENTSDDGTSLNLEGDILMNISEFFKIKSFVDLVKLLDSDKPKAQIARAREEPTTSTTVTMNKKEENIITTVSPKINENTSPKEKLKTHLKAILNDLLELQKEAGVSAKEGEIRIVDALPCIYNMINGDKFLNKATDSPIVDPYEKMKLVFNEMEKEYKNAVIANARRMSHAEFRRFLKHTPPSALVWERIVGNVNKQLSQTARRNSNIKVPVPLHELKKRISKIESTSSSDIYKTYTKLSNVPPSDQLMLLKALHAELQRGLDTLKDIKTLIELIERLPSDQKSEIREFVDNFDRKINLDKKVLEPVPKPIHLNPIVISKPILRASSHEELEDFKVDTNKKEKTRIKPGEDNYERKEKDFKLTRDEILNQLIRNRVSSYIQMAENNGINLNFPNYNIAKNILHYLEIGNKELARELFKIFVTTKEKTPENAVIDKTFTGTELLAQLTELSTTTKPLVTESFIAQLRRQSAVFNKQPLLNFEDPASLQEQLLSARRDLLLRNLLAANNYKMMS